MLLFQQSEATAAQRRVPIHLVDATDGITPETAEAAGQPQLSKNGAAFANTTATLVAIANGLYYVELTALELDTLGFIAVRYKSAATAEAQVIGQVLPWDPYDAVRAGLTALPNAAAEAAGGFYTRGTGVGQINQPASGQIDVNVLTMANAVISTLTFAAGAINAAAIAADAIGASELAADVITDVWQGTALTEAYATDGATATPAQLLYMIWAALAEFAISGTTITAKKLDGVATAMTFTLDDGTNPTSRTRAT